MNRESIVLESVILDDGLDGTGGLKSVRYEPGPGLVAGVGRQVVPAGEPPELPTTAASEAA